MNEMKTILETRLKYFESCIKTGNLKGTRFLNKTECEKEITLLKDALCIPK